MRPANRLTISRVCMLTRRLRFNQFESLQPEGPKPDRRHNAAQQPERRQTTALLRSRGRANVFRPMGSVDRKERSSHGFRFGNRDRSLYLWTVELAAFSGRGLRRQTCEPETFTLIASRTVECLRCP